MTEQTTRGLVVGRFQPFHNGHLFLVKQILKYCDELIIAIGSAQFNYMYTDPFTAGERILMIHEALLESKIDLTRCYIVPITNDENNARWFSHLKSMVPHFDILYSGNQFVRKVVSQEIKTIKPQLIETNKYNGTNIRRLMSTTQQWKKMVPASVSKIVDEIDGINRIKMLSNERLSELYKSNPAGYKRKILKP